MPRSSRPCRIGALALVLLALSACAPARASSPAASSPAQPAPARAPDAPATTDFYRGKTVRIVIAFPAGGGFDIVGRLVARYIGKYIPGNPTVIVENMPGAASMLAASNVYNVAPKDGTVIGVVNGGATVVEQLFGASGVQYDSAKMQYLGAPHVFSYVLLAGKGAEVTRFDEIVGPNAKQLVVGASNPGSSTYDAPILLREVFGADMKVVSGYDGTAPILLAIDRGEVQALFNPWESLKPAVNDRVKAGEYLILGQFTEQPLKDLPNVPEFLKLASSEEQRQLLRMGVIVPARFAVQYFVAPGVPPDRVQALQSAFDQTMADAEFRAEAERVNVEVDPLTGAQLQQLVVDFLSMPADVKAKLQKVLRP